EEQMRRVAVQMSRGEAVVQDVETLSEQARDALDMIVEATASAATGAQRIAMTSREQELEFAKLSDRVRRIAQISWRNRDGAEQVTASARDQATALRGLEGATQELRAVAIYLEDLTGRITSVRWPVVISRVGMRFHVRIGILSHERLHPQPLEIDVAVTR